MLENYSTSPPTIIWCLRMLMLQLHVGYSYGATVRYDNAVTVRYYYGATVRYDDGCHVHHILGRPGTQLTSC